jgi:hypothetical protein
MGIPRSTEVMAQAHMDVLILQTFEGDLYLSPQEGDHMMVMLCRYAAWLMHPAATVLFSHFLSSFLTTSLLS